MTDDPALTASGGFCAPSLWLYDVISSEPSRRIVFPEVGTARGGFDFTDRRTDAERAAADALQALIHRYVGDIAKAQDAVLDAACWLALAEGYDLHVQRHHGTRFIGIELAPRTTGRTFPTVHEYTLDSWRWDDLDDDEWPEL